MKNEGAEEYGDEIASAELNAAYVLGANEGCVVERCTEQTRSWHWIGRDLHKSGRRRKRYRAVDGTARSSQHN